MLVLPLQGFAAASLAFCAHAGHHVPVATEHAHAHDHLLAEHGHDGPAATSDDGAAADACNVCAACCHGIGIAQALGAPAATTAPDLIVGEPLVRIANQPLPLPERPPRA